MTKRRLLLLTLLLPVLLTVTTPAFAGHRGSWTSIQYSDVCIGGDRCGGRLELPLADAPVVAVRFYAHDDVGNKHRAHLRVSIDGDVIAYDLDIKRDGRVHELDARGYAGRCLVFTPLTNDEAVIEEVEVIYGRRHGYKPDRRDRPYRPATDGPGYGDWRPVRRAGGCFGGELCGHQGDDLVVRLSGAPLHGVRFYAHDAVGQKSGGRLRVRVDGKVIEYDLDIKRAGGVYELDVPGLRARRLVFETLSHDEVVVEDIEVLSGGRY